MNDALSTALALPLTLTPADIPPLTRLHFCRIVSNLSLIFILLGLGSMRSLVFGLALYLFATAGYLYLLFRIGQTEINPRYARHHLVMAIAMLPTLWLGTWLMARLTEADVRRERLNENRNENGPTVFVK